MNDTPLTERAYRALHHFLSSQVNTLETTIGMYERYKEQRATEHPDYPPLTEQDRTDIASWREDVAALREAMAWLEGQNPQAQAAPDRVTFTDLTGEQLRPDDDLGYDTTPPRRMSPPHLGGSLI